MSGTINVPGYPSSNRVPGVFAVVDASKANTGTINQRTLMLGQMLSSGSAVAGVASIIGGLGDAIAQAGAGSQLAIAVERYRALDSFGELWILPLADASGATAATGSITFTGTATAPGALPLYLNGVRILVPASTGTTGAALATATAAAASAYASAAGNPLPMTAAVDGTTATKVDFTARNGGTLGDQNTINLSFLGTSAGEGTPGSTNIPGITATITPFSSGAGDPTLGTPLANLPDEPFDFICCPLNDTTSLNVLAAFLGDAAGRWNWSEELFGHAFTAYHGTFSARTTWGTARNDQHATVIGAYGAANPAWVWAAENTAVHAVSLRADPALPVGGLGGGMALNVLAPPLPQRDTFSEQQSLLYDGFSTYVTDQSGVVRIQRSVTTYQTNAGGAPDNSYLDVNVPFMLTAYIRAVRSMIQSQFNQVKLVADGSRIPVGAAMVTSQTILFSVIGLYRQQALAGLVQNPDGFARAAVAQNAGGGVVKMLLPVALANQLYDVAMNVQFTRP